MDTLPQFPYSRITHDARGVYSLEITDAGQINILGTTITPDLFPDIRQTPKNRSLSESSETLPGHFSSPSHPRINYRPKNRGLHEQCTPASLGTLSEILFYKSLARQSRR
jgi:hypothetical protein